MPATEAAGTTSSDGLESLERLKQVETDGDARLRAVRGKIDLTLSQMRTDSDTQIQAAQKQAEAEAGMLLERAEKEADTEAARIIDSAKAELAQRAKAGLPGLTAAWPNILDILFGEFR
jgi:vacuolar-type H+-ATPase subunit H